MKFSFTYRNKRFHGISKRRLLKPCRERCQRLIVLDSRRKPRSILPGKSTACRPDKVCFVHMKFRRQKAMRHVAVICNEKKPLGILVKPAHGKQIRPLPLRNQVQHGFLLPVLARRQNARRLVQHVPDNRLILPELPLIDHLRKNIKSAILLQKITRIKNQLSANPDAVLPDALPELSSRAGAHVRKILINSHEILKCRFAQACSV